MYEFIQKTNSKRKNTLKSLQLDGRMYFSRQTLWHLSFLHNLQELEIVNVFMLDLECTLGMFIDQNALNLRYLICNKPHKRIFEYISKDIVGIVSCLL